MNKPLNMKPLRDPPEISEEYDVNHMHHIVDALDYLRREAAKTGSEELAMLVNSVFNICYVTYYSAARTALHDSLMRKQPN